MDCINACLLYGNKVNIKCSTYTYYTNSFNNTNESSFKNQCFGRFGYSLWIPVDQMNVNCGRIIWSCSSDLDCSLNGICNNMTSKCDCNPSWTGYHCESLHLLPATRNNGYNKLENENTSSWGGVPIIDYSNTNKSTKYHLITSEFINHCGVNSWVRNSQIILTQSTNGWNSQYNKIQIMELPFAHEPEIIYDHINNLYIMYYTHFNYSQSDWNNLTFCNCSDGSTNRDECNNKHDNIPYNPYYISSMIWSESIYGPWSQPMNILNLTWNEPNGTHDNNFAAVILNNGSLIGMMRNWIHWNNIYGSDIHLVIADNYMNNKTYRVLPNSLFPQLTQAFTEDPYLYFDCNGNYHAVFHNMDPLNNDKIVGGHAFSQNGIDWIYYGLAYDNVLQYDDGTSITLIRRERPHFLFSEEDNCTIQACSWGVVSPEYTGQYGDASFTQIQPVNTK